jgi:hypothetical protein
LLALLGAHHFLHVSRIRVKESKCSTKYITYKKTGNFKYSKKPKWRYSGQPSEFFTNTKENVGGIQTERKNPEKREPKSL